MFVHELNDRMVGRELFRGDHGSALSLDTLLPRTDQEAMAAQVPGARLAIYDGVGHLPVIEAPRARRRRAHRAMRRRDVALEPLTHSKRETASSLGDDMSLARQAAVAQHAANAAA